MFTYRYSRMLEEGSFRSNSVDFFFMYLFGALLMTLIAPFVKLLFLGHAFTIMLVYIWAKRNTAIQLSLFGLFNFRAPHLPWILLGFSLILGNSVLTDVLGISIGHIYYYLQDVFPHLPGGFRLLKTPKFIVYLFNPSEYYLDRLNSQISSTVNNTVNSIANSTSTNEANQSNNQTTTALNNANQASNQINDQSNQVRNELIKTANKESNENKVDSEVDSTKNLLNGEVNGNQTIRNRIDPNKKKKIKIKKIK